jgi:hypothetical protein
MGDGTTSAKYVGWNVWSGGMVIVGALLARVFARLPGGEQLGGARQGPGYGSEQEDETGAPVFAHDASRANRKGDEGEGEGGPGGTGGNVGRIARQARRRLVS